MDITGVLVGTSGDAAASRLVRVVGMAGSGGRYGALEPREPHGLTARNGTCR
jgi:hypothetical protein